MNDLAKNLLLWVVVAAVLMVVFQSFSPKLAASQDVVYSQFVQEVENDRIKKVDISSNERSITFERADGSTGTTTAPVRDKDLINDLIQHKVEIKQAPPDSGVSFWSLVLNFLPVLLIIGFWLFMMRQMQGGGGGKGAMSLRRVRAPSCCPTTRSRSPSPTSPAATRPRRTWPSWSSSCAIRRASRSWAARSRAAC